MRKYFILFLILMFACANNVYAFGNINAAAYRQTYQNRPSNMYRQPSYSQRYGRMQGSAPQQMPYWQRQSNYALRTNAQNTLRNNAQNLNRNYASAVQRQNYAVNMQNYNSSYGFRY